MMQYLGTFHITTSDAQGRVFRAQSSELLEAALDALAFLDEQDAQIEALVAQVVNA